MKIVVSGMLAGVPRQGGATWATLQYVLGLRRLGHDVCFVEPLARSPFLMTGADLSRSPSARILEELAARYGFLGALVLEGSRETAGASYEEVVEFSVDADLLVNLSGTLRRRELIEGIARRLYVDLDPAFTQLWHHAEGLDMGLELHDRFATFGLTIDTPTCDIPTCGRSWIPTLPPVVLAEWPALRSPGEAFTTVSNWRGYGDAEYGEVQYRQKAHSFRDLMELPRRSPHSIEVALAIHPLEIRDRRALEAHGWTLVDPWRVVGTADGYRRFVGGSAAELGIAKEGYVTARCGWFSDRSAVYLASGRPVLAQDTGLGSVLPTGAGVVAFSTQEEALAGMDDIASNYARHAVAARDWAEAYLDSDAVLAALIEAAFSAEAVPA